MPDELRTFCNQLMHFILPKTVSILLKTNFMSHMVSEFIYKFLESNMSFTVKTNSNHGDF